MAGLDPCRANRAKVFGELYFLLESAARDSIAGAHRGVSITAGALPEGVTAAVEVAAYRIVTEALTNVARHSGSSTATVCLETDSDALVIDVTDDGTGDAAWSPGVGVTSMRERAAELGGTLTVRIDGAGGHVHARLPLP